MKKSANKRITLFICFLLVITQFISAFAQAEPVETTEPESVEAVSETTDDDAAARSAAEDEANEAAVEETEDSDEEDMAAVGGGAEGETDSAADGSADAGTSEESQSDGQTDDQTYEEYGDQTDVSASGQSDDQKDSDEAITEDQTKGSSDDQTCPAFTTQTIDTGSVRIVIDVPEGAFAEKVTAKSRSISSDSVRETVEQELGGKAGSISAVDISFYTEDGKEFEPVKAVTVRVNAYGLDAESYKVVHIEDNGNTEVVASSEDSSFSFKTDSFSIYTIVGDEDGTVRRTYNFYNGDKLVDSQIVKNGDKLVEPSVPSSGKEGEMFLGWSADNGKTFQKFDKTIDDIDETADKDETVNLYACYDTAFSVIFYDRNGTVIETISGKSGDQVSVDDVSFELMAGEYVSGWTTSSDGDPSGAVDGSVTIESGNIELYPIVKNVHWLIFHDKGQDSDPSIPTHTESYYLREGQVTTRPADPTRPGYTFREWTKDGAGTEAFAFGNTLTEDTVVYAQWDPEEVSYQVFVWSESLVNGKYVEGNYALSDHYTVSAQSGSEVSISGDDDLVRTLVTDEAYQFHKLEKIDGPAVVKGDGTTVLNIYFKLKVYKLEFKAMPELYYHKGILKARNGVLTWYDPSRNYTSWLGDSYGYITISFTMNGKVYSDYEPYTIEARYGEDITSRWPDQTTAYWEIVDESGLDEEDLPVLEGLKPIMVPYVWHTNDKNQLTSASNSYLSKMTNLTKALINLDSSDTMLFSIQFGIHMLLINGNYCIRKPHVRRGVP